MFYFIKKYSVTPCLFSMTTKENRQCYPYGFLYVMFYFIKNDSVTFYLFCNDDQKNDSVTPYVLFGKKTTVLPLIFDLI